jgi:hypothetical protein
MKRKLFSLLLGGLLLSGTAFFVTSCDSDDTVETAWDIQHYPVEASEWSWNSAGKRWEAVKQLKYIDEFIYEKGAVIGYVFLGEPNRDEVQTQLPCTRAYHSSGNPDFTETIGCEYSRLTNRVTFYIQPSDGIQDPNAKVYYAFRIVMIW